MMANSVKFEYAVYLLPKSAKDPEAVFRKLIAKNFSQLKIVEEISTNPAEALVSGHFQRNVAKEYAPPGLESLRHAGHGLTPAQEHALQKTTEAFILQFAYPRELVWTALRNADLLVEGVARHTGGLVWDEATREVFTPDAWHERRLASWPGGIPDVHTQTVVHIYQDGEFIREITLGMEKAGLPDVVVEGASWSMESRIAGLINEFCQVMAEGQLLAVPGKAEMNVQTIRNDAVRTERMKSFYANATGIAHLYLKIGQKQDGDADNRLIEITAERYTGPDIHAKQDRMVSCTFGAEPDKVKYIKHDDQLLDASRKARLKLPELKEAFRKGLPPGEHIDLKAPFESWSGHEWMWIEVTGWKDQKITGLLQNEPADVADLHAGQLVEVKEEDIFDYVRYYADGHKQGNATGEIIERMEEEKDRTIHAFRDGGNTFSPRPNQAGCDPK
ncbi:MAG TPA: DUF2314 domain-containing protein [Candidatus Acidoferrum sp.]|jgi:uncharacterized protein YegJ (DUF2314 family)